MFRNVTSFRSFSPLALKYRFEPLHLSNKIVESKGTVLDYLRECDLAGILNEFHGPTEIIMELVNADLYESPSLGIRAWFIICDVTNYLRSFIGRQPDGRIEVDVERGLPGPGVLPRYKFDLGSRTKYLGDMALLDGKRYGRIMAYQTSTTSGFLLDVLEVTIQTNQLQMTPTAHSGDIRAQITTFKCASEAWIFDGQFKIFIMAESTSEHTWTAQQWFRKIRSDMALIESVFVPHPAHWFPVAGRRLRKSMGVFKLLFKTATGEGRVVKDSRAVGEKVPLIFRDDMKMAKSDNVKYQQNGRECRKGMAYYPCTQTKVVAESYSANIANCKDVCQIATELFETWAVFKTEISNNNGFVSLKELVEIEQNLVNLNVATNEILEEPVKSSSEFGDQKPKNLLHDQSNSPSEKPIIDFVVMNEEKSICKQVGEKRMDADGVSVSGEFPSPIN